MGFCHSDDNANLEVFRLFRHIRAPQELGVTVGDVLREAATASQGWNLMKEYAKISQRFGPKTIRQVMLHPEGPLRIEMPLYYWANPHDWKPRFWRVPINRSGRQVHPDAIRNLRDDTVYLVVLSDDSKVQTWFVDPDD